MNINNPPGPDNMYGPVNIDDALIQVSFAPAGSPQPVPAAENAALSYTDASQQNVTITNDAFPGLFAPKSYRVYKFDLSLSRNDAPAIDGNGNPVTYDGLPAVIGGPGTLIWCVWADDTSAAPDSYFPGPAVTTPYAMLQIDRSDPFPFGPAFQISGIPFQSLTLRNPAQTHKRLWLLIALDAPVDRLDAAN
jgi:hypothetical protein